MAYHIVRVTLYVLLTAIERDLRQVIQYQILKSSSAEEAIPEKILIECRRRADQDGIVEPNGFVDYLEFGEAIEVVKRNLEKCEPVYRECLKKIGAKTEKIVQTRNRVMHSRPMDFDDHITIHRAGTRAPSSSTSTPGRCGAGRCSVTI